MRILLFITKKFPFGKGEEFIENEIEYLCDKYDTVILASVSANKKVGQTRHVPENTRIVRINDIGNELCRYAFYFLLAIPFLFDKEMRNEMKAHRGFAAKAAVMYAYARVNRNYKKLLKIKDKNLYSDGDSLTIYSYWFSDTAYLACRLKERIQKNQKDIPIVVISRAHRYDLFPDLNKAKTIPFRDFCMEQIDMVYPCSNVGTKFLKTQYSQYSHKISTAYLGTPDRGLCNFCHEANEFCIVTCSGITEVKRVGLVARALHVLLSRGISNIRWLCIGDGPLLNALKNYVSEKMPDIDAKFLGYLSNSNVMSIYKNEHIDVFINTSANEGLPVSIMEAQSFGIPVIATDVGGTSEIVIDGVTGIVLPPNPNEIELADAISNIMNMPHIKYSMLSFEARKRWNLSFNSYKNYPKFTDELTSLLEDSDEATFIY